MYGEYIWNHAEDMVALAVETADIPALEGLYAMGIPALETVDAVIASANELRRRDAVVSLMEYKHRQVKAVSVEEQLSAAFDFDDF